MSAVATWAGGSARRATARSPQIVAVSAPYVVGYSTNGGSYITGLAIPHAPNTSGEDRALAVLVSYQAKAAGVRDFELPEFDEVAFTEAVPPTSAGDKTLPGTAIYWLADPGTDPADLVLDFGEDMISVGVVIVDLAYFEQSTPFGHLEEPLALADFR